MNIYDHGRTTGSTGLIGATVRRINRACVCVAALTWTLTRLYIRTGSPSARFKMEYNKFSLSHYFSFHASTETDHFEI